MWLAYGLVGVTALLWGLQAVAHDRATHLAGPYGAQLAMAIVAVIMAIAEIPILCHIARVHRQGEFYPAIGWGIVSILCGILGTTTYHEAFTRLPPTKVIPMTSAYPLVAILISVLVYKIPTNQNTIVGSILIALGCALIAR